MRSGSSIKGAFHAYLYGPDGKLKTERHVYNMIVWTGEQHIADQMSDQGQAAMSHMAVGAGAVAPTSGDTTLGSELDRNVLTKTQGGGGTAQNNVRYEASWAAGDGTGAITEAGIFNAAAAGTMLARVAFAVINKGASDTLDVDWDITYDDDGV